MVVKTELSVTTRYSCLTVLIDGRGACFCETGLQKPYEGIAYITVKTEDIVRSEK